MTTPPIGPSLLKPLDQEEIENFFLAMWASIQLPWPEDPVALEHARAILLVETSYVASMEIKAQAAKHKVRKEFNAAEKTQAKADELRRSSPEGYIARLIEREYKHMNEHAMGLTAKLRKWEMEFGAIKYKD